LPLISTFILRDSFYVVRIVGSTTTPRVATGLEKSLGEIVSLFTVESRGNSWSSPRDPVSSGAQKWNEVWCHSIKAA